MTDVLVAGLAAGCAAGLLLAVAGARGRPVLHTASVDRLARLASSAATTRAILAVTLALLATAATGWLAAGLLAGFGVVLGRRVVGGKADRERVVARTEAIAAWTEMVRDSIVAASGLEEAIRATGSVAPVAIAPEVRTLTLRLQHSPLTDALTGFAADLDHPCGDLVTTALVLAAQMEASDLGSLLTRLAEATRGEARMRVRVEVGRARVRTATRIILGVVAASFTLLAVGNRSYLDVYDTVTGQIVLMAVVGLFGLGGWLLDRMSRVELPDRFTARTRTSGAAA